MPEPEVTSHQRWRPHRVEAGTSMAASISVPKPPEVVASAAGEEVTRSGLRRAYLLLARRPASTYCVASQRPTGSG
jgi:hypothetical protein